MSFDIKFIPLSFINSDEELLRQIKNTVLISFLLNKYEETTLDYYLDTTQYGYTASALQSGKHKLVRITDINDGNVNWATVPFCDCDTEEKYLLKDNDILVARTGGTTGKSFIVENPPKNAVFASYLIRLRLNHKADVSFITCFLNSYAFWSQIIEMKSGSAMPNVNAEKLKTLKLPKCDLTTQQKFISAFNKNSTQNEFNFLAIKISSVERLYSNNKEFANELTHQLALVKNLRQQLLQDAVQGKLAPQNPEDEPAGALLKKIKAEKEKLIAEKKLKTEKALPPIKPEEIPFEIPGNWIWCRLGALRDIRYSLSYGVLVPGNDVPNGVPFVRVQDLDYADKNELPVKHISSAIDKQYSKTRLIGGEILICVVGSVGKVAISPNSWIGANIARAVCRYMPNSNISKEFIYYCLISPFIQFFFQEGKKSVNPTLNVNVLETTLIPLPPFAEQTRIVQKLEELMRYCDGLEAGIKESMAQNERLLQQVLREALRG